MQEEDPSLIHLRRLESVSEGQVTDERRASQWPRIVVMDGVWHQKVGRERGGASQVLLAEPYRAKALEQVHNHLWVGHEGAKNTQERLKRQYFWPALKWDVRTYCQSCPICQRCKKCPVPRAPLQPLALVGLPFKRVAMDFLGPFFWTHRGACYLLVLIDYATRYSEAILLASLASSGVARTLMRFLTHMGLPKALLMDWGSPFTSTLMRQVCQTLGIAQLFVAVQHPQMDGLTERLNQTLKGMLVKAIKAYPRSWDLCVDPFHPARVPPGLYRVLPF